MTLIIHDFKPISVYFANNFLDCVATARNDTSLVVIERPVPKRSEGTEE